MPRLKPHLTWTSLPIFDLLVIAVLVCLSIIIVNPFGNFPLNDDWSYTLTVKHFLENADFRPTGWASMLLFTHTLWGSLFCLPAGFSFTALRFSTLTLALFGSFGCYLLSRELGQSRTLALIAALVLAFNPLYFLLSFTFMTDVPFTALSIFATLFFVKNLKSAKKNHLFIATFFAIAALLSRQLALAMPLAFALTVLISFPLTKNNMLRAILPLLICGTIFLAFQHWLSISHRLPSLYNAKMGDLLQVLMNSQLLFRNLFVNGFSYLLYIGLFMLPILLAATGNLFPVARKKFISITVLVMVLLVVIDSLRAAHGLTYLMPLADNLLIPSGLGQLTLRDTDILHLNHVSALPDFFWITASIFSLIGAALFITIFSIHFSHWLQQPVRRAKKNPSNAIGIFFIFCAVIYLLPLLIIHFYDRYSIPTLYFFTAAIFAFSKNPIKISPRLLRSTIIVLLIIFAFFSIFATKNYLSWNRTRWQALQDLMVQQIKPSEIDGGFEFNGWYLYNPHYLRDPKKSKWWVENDRYQIAFGNVPGYKIIKEYRYFSWLPPQHRQILVLEKNSF